MSLHDYKCNEQICYKHFKLYVQDYNYFLTHSVQSLVSSDWLRFKMDTTDITP